VDRWVFQRPPNELPKKAQAVKWGKKNKVNFPGGEKKKTGNNGNKKSLPPHTPGRKKDNSRECSNVTDAKPGTGMQDLGRKATSRTGTTDLKFGNQPAMEEVVDEERKDRPKDKG